jgi:hypothetical protein
MAGALSPYCPGPELALFVPALYMMGTACTCIVCDEAACACFVCDGGRVSQPLYVMGPHVPAYAFASLVCDGLVYANQRCSPQHICWHQ